MTVELIAQFDTDKLGEWMKIIIIVLVIGGSAFGGVIKALIRKFGGQTDGKNTNPDIPEFKPRRQSVPPIESTPTLLGPQMPKPISHERDTGQREIRRPAQPTPMARPVMDSMPEALSELLPELLPLPTPPTRKRMTQATDRADSERPQQQRKPKRHRRPQRREQPPPTPAKSLAEKLSDPKYAEQRFGRLTTSLGTLETHVDEATPTAIVSIDLDPILNPTPQSLRQAIIMSEVLGPPIALRSAGANLWDA